MILLGRLKAHGFKGLRSIDLPFPAAGTVLIEGNNEAGKSSLFEAVFFALYGQAPRRAAAGDNLTHDELLGYGAKDATVELEFTVEGRPFVMRRRLPTSRPPVLEYIDREGAAQVVRGARAVEAVLQEEMRLSAAALLNTCFVEQKRLEQLEQMDLAARRRAIDELLNLKVLGDLEARFKLPQADRSALEPLEERVRIAEADAELETLRSELRRSARRARYARLIENAAERRELEQQLAAAEAERQRLDAARDAEQRHVHVRTDLWPRVREWQSAEAEYERARERREQIVELARPLPGIQDERQRLESRVTWLERHEERKREIQSLDRELALVAQLERPARSVRRAGFGLMAFGVALVLSGAFAWALVGSVALVLTLAGVLAAASGAGLVWLRRPPAQIPPGRDRAALSARKAELAREVGAPETAETGSKIGSVEEVQQELLELGCTPELLTGLPAYPGENAALQSLLRWRATCFRDVESLVQAAAANLPAAEEDLGGARRRETAARQALGERWDEILTGEPLPDTPAEAEKHLEQWLLGSAAVQATAASLRPNAREESPQIGLGRVQGTIDLLRQRLRRARGEEVRFRRSFRLLDDANLCTLPHEVPELTTWNERPLEDWERILKRGRDAARENRSRRRAWAAAQGLDRARLNIQEELAGLREARQQLTERQWALEILKETRQSIVRQVMPLTIRNMQQLLPLLTDGRYHEAQWDEETNTLSVYDEHARSFQRKRVFSGGARDQISLALRLGFALATLPGEHQCRPGFLFLDEPLSSFDRGRTRALVDLLTGGVLRQHFQQILLISHSESFEPELFDYRLRMAGGQIAESTLPPD